MSGHSHWSSIKHKKQATDAKKGKYFSKATRLIMVAAREGGPDPDKNIKLQYAIEKAREVNMPNDNIDRAIKKGSGELGGAQLESVMYEGYGPAGIAIMVEALTDNRNRTVSEIRKIFETRGGTLGESNSVRWMFDRKGFITIPKDNIKEDEVLTAALDVGADDAALAGEAYEITCGQQETEQIKQALIKKGFKPKSAEVIYLPKNYIGLSQSDSARIIALMDALEDHDDVQNVYANFDITE